MAAIFPCASRLKSFSLAFFLLGTAFFSFPSQISALPPESVQNRILQEAKDAFREILQLWREELYAELYHMGTLDTQRKVLQEDFVQRMIAMLWRPINLSQGKMEGQFIMRGMVVVEVELEYENKFSEEETLTKKSPFFLVYEDNQWKVDLLRWIGLPYF